MILDITKEVYNQLELLKDIDKYHIAILYKSNLERFLAERIKQEILCRYNIEIKLIEYNNIDCIYVCFLKNHIELELTNSYSNADMTMRWHQYQMRVLDTMKDCYIKTDL